MTIDYKDTVTLPKTDFPMRANLPNNEKIWLQHWQEINLYEKIMQARKDAPLYTLHDGPPYANGDIHIGHALNKCLKDFVLRAKSMKGYKAPYVPGWDCHGLPIEWKVEENYRKKKANKDDIPINVFRNECREFAKKWVDIQREDFQRFGGLGDWYNPYLTMDFKAEAIIAEEIGKFLLNGSLYKGYKPVFWSVVEKTALAEAEVEYDDNHVSDSVYIAFKVDKTADDRLKDAFALIWTTTPWTIPSNRAICYSNNIDYGLYEVNEAVENSLTKVGTKIIIAKSLADDIAKNIGASKLTLLCDDITLDGIICKHPWSDEAFYDREIPLLQADYVADDAGSGLVHTAPQHGIDDFTTGRKHNLDMTQLVQDNGVFVEEAPIVGGNFIFKANEVVINALKDVNALLGHSKLTHSYPISWRSKKPLIYRLTPQWFIALDDENGLRKKAMQALDNVNFFPSTGKVRLSSMVEGRPDWCVSRQRAWGVPIAIFVNKATGEPLRDAKVMQNVVDIFAKEGADAWFEKDNSEFLGDDYNADDFEKVFDILDVWFDSGSTHAFVLEQREELASPADLYLEGSDQHRGWFQSSLLESCGTRGVAPYKAVLTHGFVLDKNGHKMSKSLGNTVAPQKVIEQYGADILRLWVASSDYNEDLRISDEALKGTTDMYRRIRNTLRWLLGNLNDYQLEEIDYNELPELEQYILHKLVLLQQTYDKAVVGEFNFHKFISAIHHFCNIDLSAVYFDIRKDSLYCDAIDSPRRKACLFALHYIFENLVKWLSPFICFSADEAWKSRYPDAVSIHLETLGELPNDWHNEELFKKWERILDIRSVITGALELERKEKNIGSSLEAAPTLYLANDEQKMFADISWEEISITSKIEVSDIQSKDDNSFALENINNVAVMFKHASGDKCPRCWQITPKAGDENHPDLCPRCLSAMK